MIKLRARLVWWLVVFLVVVSTWFGAVIALAQGPVTRPTPTTMPGAPSSGGQNTTALQQPDLVVKAINVLPSNPYVDQEFTIEVIIANQGDADVPVGNNFFVDLYIDPPTPPPPGYKGTPTFSWGVQYFWVPAGGEWSLRFTTVFTNTGGHQVFAVIDPDGFVVERDEENNVEGPVLFSVRTTHFWRQSTHEDFQKGFSNLDLSHPRGLVQLGLWTDFFRQTGDVVYLTQQFDEPEFDRALYFPDTRVNPITYTDSLSRTITDTVSQIKPVLTKGPGNEIAIIWEDWRNGGLDSDIYFARSSDNGKTWSNAVRVNQDPIDSGQSQLDPVVIYNEACGRYHAFWADNRLGSFDIWHAYSTDGVTWVEPPVGTGSNPINTFTDDPLAPQTKPTVDVDDNGVIYLAWQDRRKGNDDIFFAYSTDCGQTWSDNAFVTDDPSITTQDQRAPSIAVVSGSTLTETEVYLAWQDTRNDAGDVFVVFGRPSPPPLEPFTFDIDVKMNTDDATALQRDPALDAVPIFIEVEYTVEIDQNTSVDCTVEWRTTAIHVAWQDYRNGNADVFYGWMFSNVVFSRIINGDNNCLREPEFSTNKPQIQPFTPVTNFNVQTVAVPPLSEAACWGPNSDRTYDQTQTWQGDPTVKVVNEFTVRVGWSDGRSYDDLNYDIHIASFSRLDKESFNYLDSVGWGMVNNNVKRLQAIFDEEKGLYRDGYADYLPAGASQRRPTMLADPFVVAWDDNRYDNPSSGGQINRDIFSAEFVGEPRGTYISPVFDAGAEAVWYDIQWWAATQTDASLVLQTRLGTTPNPPMDDVEANGWTRWSGVGGAGGVYDAPGQNIRDADGKILPKARYVQYRILINQDRPPGVTSKNGACVSEVTLNYQPIFKTIFLPIVQNGASGGTGTTAVPNDEYYQTYQWNLKMVNAEAAWAQSKGDNVIIAIVDTGIDSGHPEFAGKLVNGYDFVNDDSDPDDEDGHGTHVAGIAAAMTNNNEGVAGMGWNALIMPLKVFDNSGFASDSDVAAAIRYAADNGAKIINLSLGGPNDSQTIRDAIQYASSKGVLVIAASGNEYKNNNPTIYPAAIPEVLAVAAVDDQQQHASYSSAGAYVDVAAPGGDPTDQFDSTVTHWIWSTYPRTMAGIPKLGYNAEAGTSQATPLVSGLAALIWSKNPSLSASQVASIIINTVTDLGAPGKDDFFGYGLVNAGAAVQQASVAPRLTSMARRTTKTPYTGAPQPFNRVTGFKPGELLVGLRPGVTVASVEAWLGTYGATPVEEVLEGVWLVRVPVGQELSTLTALVNHPAVRYAEPNYLYTLQ